MLNRKSRKKRNYKWIPITLVIIVFAAAAALLWAFQIETRLVVHRNYSLNSDQLPAQWQGKTIGFFSDVHAGPGYNGQQLAKAVDKLMAENPDIIFYGGDLVDSSTPLDDIDFAREIIEQLSRLDAPLGKFAVIGNHDNRLNHELQTSIEWLEAAGFKVLINQAVVVDEVWIGGLDESYFGSPDLDFTMDQPLENENNYSNVNEDDLFRIMLMHQPDYLPEYETSDRVKNLDLILSGHSHNGQITLFGIPLMKVHQGEHYTRGLYLISDNPQSKIVVTGGLGTVLIHARFFNPPEIVTISLNSN